MNILRIQINNIQNQCKVVDIIQNLNLNQNNKLIINYTITKSIFFFTSDFLPSLYYSPTQTHLNHNNNIIPSNNLYSHSRTFIPSFMSLPPSQNLLLNSSSITYRNAIYQGQINQQKQTRKNFGIVYVAKTHEFVCCNNWHNDNLQGQCLFFNDNKQYIYGTWINNLPQGFNVFRFDQILFIANFNRGKLSKNSKLLIIFQKYNLAAILLVLNDSDKLDDLELQVFSKAQVFSPEDINKLFNQCNWPSDYFIQNQTLIKYISHKLTRPPAKYQHTSKNQAKLRLIENKYYRFGYDQGLAIVFDEDFIRISVGCHSKAKLKSFGVVFDQKPKPLTPYSKVQQGKIIKITPQKNILTTSLKNEVPKPQNPQQNQKLKTNLLMGFNFCNKFFKNPSKVFVFYIQNIISQQTIKKIIAGSLTTRRMFEESLDFSKIQQNNDFSQDLLEKDLRKPNNIAPITHLKQRTQKFDKQKLTCDRLRLQAIKRQIYDSLEKRKQTTQNIFIDQEFSREIIHKQIVGSNYNNNFMETPSRTEKGKSRKRIFEESDQNLKLLRDFTPTRSQPNLTPFKTKMKNRIFNGQQSKNSMRGDKNYQYESYGQDREKQNIKQIFANEEAQVIEMHFPEQHTSNKFSSKHSIAKDSRSKGKIRDLRNKDSGTMGKQEYKFSNKFDDRHVTFEDRVQIKDSLNINHNSKDTFESGKNPQYFRINPMEERDRKRSIQHTQSHKESRGSNADGTVSPNHFSREDRDQDQKKQAQKRLTPKSKYYLEEKSSKHLQSKSYINQNESRKQQNLTPKIMDEGYKIQYHREERDRKRQNQSNFIYQDDTFKQTTLPQEFESNKLLRQRQTEPEDRHRRSAFRNSNEVYLDQLKQKYSPMKSTQMQTYGNKNDRYQNPANRTMPYMLPFNENRSNSKDNYNNSYKVKHQMKKSMEKVISKSPDKNRCYGKNMNNPYIEASPKYSKEGTYRMSYNKYDSPHMISRNDTYNMTSTGRNPMGRLF